MEGLRVTNSNFGVRSVTHSLPRWYQYCYRGGARKPRFVIAFVQLLLDFPDTGRRMRTIDPRGWHPFPLGSFNSQTGIAAHSTPHEWMQLFHVTLKRRTPWTKKN